MLAEILNGLRDQTSDDVFLGVDRISHDEFADLVFTYAGGLRARKLRAIVLVGRPGPTTLAMTLAGIGTGTRVDLIDPHDDEALVTARLEAGAADITVAESGMAWPLRGPDWLRRIKKLPQGDVWPTITPIDSVGGAQQRRFGLEPDAPALGLFRGDEEPLGVVHTVASLSLALEALADLVDGDGPMHTDSMVMMLACLGSGRQIVRNPKNRRIVHRYTRSESDVTTLSTLDGPTRRVFGVPALFPIATADDDGPWRLVDGIDAELDGDILRLSGPAMAPRNIEGDYRDDVEIRGSFAKELPSGAR